MPRRFAWMVLLLALAALGIGRVRVDTAPLHMLRSSDPEAAAYRDLQQWFGGDDVVIVALRGDALFTPETLVRMDAIAARLARVPGVASIVAPTRVPRMPKGAVLPVFGPPATEAEAQEIHRCLLEGQVYRRVLVSDDGRTLAILVDLKPGEPEDVAVDGVARIVDEERGQVGAATFHISGLPFIRVGLEHAMASRFRWLLPAALAILAGLVWGMTRSVRSTLYVCVTASSALIAALGLLGWFRWPLHAGNWAALPASALGGALMGALLLDGRVSSARLLTALPALLAAPLALGASLLIPHLQALVVAASGLAMGALAAVVFRPDVAGDPPPFLPPARWPAWAAALLVAAGLGAGASRWTYDANFLEAFSPRHPLMKDLEVIDRDLTGIVSCQILLEGGKGALRDLDTLKAIEAFQKWADAQPGVRKTVSVVDIVAETNCMAHRNDPKFRVLPDAASLDPCIKRIELMRSAGVGRLVDRDYARGRMSLTVASLGTSDQWALQQRVIAKLRECLGDRLKFRVTGLSRLWAYLESGLEPRIPWMGAAWLLAALLAGMAVRRPGMLWPALLTLAAVVGLMGWLSVKVNVTTCAIPLVALPAAVIFAAPYSTAHSSVFRIGAVATAVTCAALIATGFRLHVYTGGLGLAGLALSWLNLKAFGPGHGGSAEDL